MYRWIGAVDDVGMKMNQGAGRHERGTRSKPLRKQRFCGANASFAEFKDFEHRRRPRCLHR